MIFCSSVLCAQDGSNEEWWGRSPYFDTSFLQKYDLVKSVLIEREGFFGVEFTTDDGIPLRGLMLTRPDARYTLISCAGFYPGRKEGMATLFHILPSDCNILFFDARGHGESSGPFITTLRQYGQHEYKDVIAAIRYVHEVVQGDIVLHAICAGSFHALHALARLDNELYSVRGIIVDSGFASLLKAIDLVHTYTQLKIVPSCLIATLYTHDTKKEVINRCAYTFIWSTLSLALNTVDFFMRPSVAITDSTMNLHATIEWIRCPIFYIHAKDDKYAPIEEIQALADKTFYKECWWVDSSDHVVNHLLYKYEYRNRLIAFIDKILCQSALSYKTIT